MILTNPKMISISTNAIHSSFFIILFFSSLKNKDSRLFAFIAFYFCNSASFRFVSPFIDFFPLLFIFFCYVFFPQKKEEKFFVFTLSVVIFLYIPINQVFIYFVQTFHSYLYSSIQSGYWEFEKWKFRRL